MFTEDEVAALPADTELLVARTIVVDLGEETRTLVGGEVVRLEEIPAGSRRSMLGLGELLVPPGPDEAAPDEPAGGGEGPIPVESIGLPAKLADKLREAGLTDRDRLLAYAQENDGLGDLVTAAEAKKVFAALEQTAGPDPAE